MEELKLALNSTKNTAPVPDQVHNKMLKHLPPTALQFILSLYNHIWAEDTVPSSWLEAIIIPAPKEGID
jgi:hypothetical protein